MKLSYLSRIETWRRQYGSRAYILLQDSRQNERALNYRLDCYVLRWELPVSGSVFVFKDAEADIGETLLHLLNHLPHPFQSPLPLSNSSFLSFCCQQDFN